MRWRTSVPRRPNGSFRAKVLRNRIPKQPGGRNGKGASGAELVLRGWFCLVRRLSIRWADGSGVRPTFDGPLPVKKVAGGRPRRFRMARLSGLAFVRRSSDRFAKPGKARTPLERRTFGSKRDGVSWRSASGPGSSGPSNRRSIGVSFETPVRTVRRPPSGGPMPEPAPSGPVPAAESGSSRLGCLFGRRTPASQILRDLPGTAPVPDPERVGSSDPVS